MASANPAAKPNQATQATQATKKRQAEAKPERVKLVRDGFTMPEPDFALIGELKARAMALGRETKKSELLRAGLHALARLQPAALARALSQLEPVPQGRPKKNR